MPRPSPDDVLSRHAFRFIRVGYFQFTSILRVLGRLSDSTVLAILLDICQIIHSPDWFRLEDDTTKAYAALIFKGYPQPIIEEETCYSAAVRQFEK